MRLNRDDHKCTADWCLVHDLRQRGNVWSRGIEHDFTIWPQSYNEYYQTWEVFVVDRINGKSFKLKSAKFCGEHMSRLYADHEQLGREEVEVYEATCRYHDAGGR